jgi:ABC-type polysaccharide/polyol phosphate transport system ATPase subunit
MSEKMAISVRDVTKKFRLARDKPDFLKEAIRKGEKTDYTDFWALNGVSFDVEEGSMFGIIGHNGSGKSTLLRMLANIYRPTSGSIRTKGRISALLELGTGFHPQLSGRENIYLNASILGIPQKIIQKRIDDIIAFADIGEFIDSPVKIYSSGMKVRLGFSVAVHVEPDILLLDEVVAVGDERFKRRCFEHIYELRRQGVTIVLVTHSLGQVQSLCDQAIWMAHGEILEHGHAIDVARSYLNQVNITEAEAGFDGELGDADLILEGRGERRGTGEITIEHVSFVNAHKAVTPFANSGRPLVCRIHYKAHEPVKNPSFALRFHTDSGTMVTAPNSRRGRINTGTVEGEGVIFYKIPRMHLTPGTYHLTAGVYDENNLHVFDQREREFELRVQPGNANDAEGYLDMGGTWAMPGRGDAEDDELESAEVGAPIAASAGNGAGDAEVAAEHDGAA